MSSTHARIALLLGSTTLALGIAWGVLAWRKAHAELVVVDVVDTTADYDALLREQQGEAVPLEDGDGAHPRLVRRPMTAETAGIFFPQVQDGRDYNTRFYFAMKPNQAIRAEFPAHPDGGWIGHTNSLGMRQREEVRAVKPELRVLVSGDSHMCIAPTDQLLFKRLEAALEAKRPPGQVECLNASAGGYNPYNYLGVLEHYLPLLKPDAFVAVVYGGNDFSPMLAMQRYFHKRPPPRREPTALSYREIYKQERPRNIGTQELSQVRYFCENPEDVDVAVETLDAITEEMETVCRAAGVAFVLVYLPPPFIGQPHMLDRDDMAHDFAIWEVTAEQTRAIDGIADRWLAAVLARGAAVIDLRPMFQASQVRLYYDETDCHINHIAQQQIAERVAPVLENLLKRG